MFNIMAVDNVHFFLPSILDFVNLVPYSQNPKSCLSLRFSFLKE